MMFIRTLKLYEKEHRYGYKDKDTGEIVIEPHYENGKEYPIIIENKNYFAVKSHGKWGLINMDNEVVIDFLYENIGRVKLEKGSPEFVMCFQQQGEVYFKIGIISTKLKVTVPPVLDRFPENITVLGVNTCWYYINKGDKRGSVKSDGTVVMKIEHTKEEVINQTTKQCGNLILEYKKHEDNDFWLREAMQSKEYSELFEWD